LFCLHNQDSVAEAFPFSFHKMNRPRLAMPHGEGRSRETVSPIKEADILRELHMRRSTLLVVIKQETLIIWVDK
jgi:hypothetical protein